MQNCEKCNSTFRWSNIFKSFKWTYKPIECDNCGTKYSITLFGRCMVAVLTVLPMWIFVSFLSPFNNLLATIGVGFLIAMISLILTPYVARYKEQL